MTSYIALDRLPLKVETFLAESGALYFKQNDRTVVEVFSEEFRTNLNNLIAKENDVEDLELLLDRYNNLVERYYLENDSEVLLEQIERCYMLILNLAEGL